LAADWLTADELDDADEDTFDEAGVTTPPTWAVVEADPAGVAADAPPSTVAPVSPDPGGVDEWTVVVGPEAPWTIPGPEWSPVNGTMPVEAPTTVMVSAAVVVATASLATDPNPANFANSPARKPVPNIFGPFTFVASLA